MTDAAGQPGAEGAQAEIRRILAALARTQHLGESDSRTIFDLLFGGNLDDAQIGAMLALFASRRVQREELVGAARAMRAHATTVPFTPPDGAVIIDTCGTGGAPKTFNISTASAIVAAAAGRGRIRVAKHGNRSRTGRGSAEVLSALGVNVEASPQVQARCLERAHVCFCFAIHHHPAARFAAGARRSLGFPTIFSLLGPLTNPARAARQVIGIYDRSLVDLMAHTLAALGAERALVVHGHDGIDEITTTSPTQAAIVQDGAVSCLTLDALDAGAPRASPDSLRAHTLDEAAAIVRRVLDGAGGPQRDIVTVNAGAALWIGGVADSLSAGNGLAQSAIDSGAAAQTLETLAALSHERG